MGESEHIYRQIQPGVLLEFRRWDPGVQRVDDNAFAGRVEDEPPLNLFVVCHCYFYLETLC